MSDRRDYFREYHRRRYSDPAYAEACRERFRAWRARLTPEQQREHRIRQKIATAVSEEAAERGCPRADVLSSWGLQ